MHKKDKLLVSEDNSHKESIPFLFFSRTPSQIGTRLEIVEKPSQYRALLKLRKKIFVEREGYPFTALCNGLERESVHILAKLNGKYVGMISVKLDDINSLPIEKFINLGDYASKRIAEFDKLGVLNMVDENVQRSVFYELVGAAYGLVRFCGYNSIVIFTLKSKSYNLAIYQKMGFEVIREFIIFDNVSAVAMFLDLDRASGLMWKTSQLTKLAKRLVATINNSHNPE